MSDPVFYLTHGPFSLEQLTAATDAELARPGADGLVIDRVATLDDAGPGAVTFFDNLRYREALQSTQASVILTQKRYISECPNGAAILVTRAPANAFAAVVRMFHPDADRPKPVWSDAASPAAHIAGTAILEDDVSVEPGAVIADGAGIGTGTRIGAGAIVGPGVQIGRHCSIGPQTTVLHAIVGDHVILHPGVRVGQDGFGYSSSAEGHAKVPQIGRVILQNAVEIGANSCIDRGALRDTVIGEGTKIDNLVQIGHNVQTGRHCMIVAGVSLAGSVVLGDFVAIGGHTVVNNHVRLADGVQIAGISVVNDDVPAGGRWGGTPARPVKQWMRDIISLERLAKEEQARRSRGRGGSEDE